MSDIIMKAIARADIGKGKRLNLNPTQMDANTILHNPHIRHALLYGGARSGKSFIICRAIVLRALKCASSHVVLRHRLSHLKESIINDTMAKVYRDHFPDVTVRRNKSDLVDYIGDSRILYGGLDDKERVEKILGQEHSTIYLNEASQIAYHARNTALTRLAQQSGLSLKEYVDLNPPGMGHWTYRLWFKGIEPRTGKPLQNAHLYAHRQMNPEGNLPNIAPEFLQTLADMTEAERQRYLYGMYQAEVAGALWSLDQLDMCKMRISEMPTLQRIVVAIDPSGCSGPEDKRSDEVGIVCAGVDREGNGYLLADRSGRYGPEEWGSVAVNLYRLWGADCIVGERNFGGAMVGATIRAIDRNVNFKEVTASRGKAVRAEPIAALYEKGRVKHVLDDEDMGDRTMYGPSPELEEQFTLFNRAGYQGPTSPDRADAAIWALSELMLQDFHYGLLDAVG